jgi:hypothetical protein
MTKGDNLGVVVQGSVHPQGVPGKISTAAVLDSVRKARKAAEIILSTWKGQDTAGLGAVPYNDVGLWFVWCFARAGEGAGDSSAVFAVAG